MLFEFSLLGVPVRKYYFEHCVLPSLADLLFPTAMLGCPQESRPVLFTRTSQHTRMHDLTLQENEIFSSFQPYVRDCIHEAQKFADFILDINPPLEEFRKFALDFAGSHELTWYELDAMDQSYDYHYSIYALRRAGEIALGHLYLCSPLRGICSLLISARDDVLSADRIVNDRMACANMLLHWRAMRDFKAQGYRLYDWGGQHDSHQLRQFNGKPLVLYNYYSPVYVLLKWVRRR